MTTDYRNLNRPRPAKYLGFTMIEVASVTGVLSLLLALFAPSVFVARETSRNNVCKNNLKQLALAYHNYCDVFSVSPPGWIGVKDHKSDALGGNGFGWQVYFLPFLEQSALYNRFDFKVNVDDANHVEALNVKIPVFECPDHRSQGPFTLVNSTGAERGIGPANYAMNFGAEDIQGCYEKVADEKRQPKIADGQCTASGLGFHNSSVRFREVTDGLSNTALFWERLSQRVDNEGNEAPWGTWVGVFPGMPGFASRSLASGHLPPNKGVAGVDFGSPHKGANLAVADGSVRLVSEHINSDLLKALSTRKGGEIVGEF